MTHADDQVLLQQFRVPESREQAFTALIRKYQERLYWHIRRLVVNHDDTHDVLQNVFIKVWKGLDGFKENSQIYTWLYRIASNESITFLEQQQRKKADFSMSDVGNFLENQIRAEKGFDAAQLEWKLQLAIQQLPEKQRIVFNLRYFDEMPYEAMSKILDTSEGGLKASYHHAAKKIEAFLLEQAEQI